METQTLEISWRSIFRIVITFFALYTVFLIQDILLLSVFGLVIAILFEAPIRILSKKMPKGLAIIFLYSSVLVLLSFLIYLPASSLVDETKEFINLFPVYFEQIAPPLRKLGLHAFEDINSFIAAMEKTADVLSSNVLNVLFSIFGGVASTIYVLSIAVFVSLEGDNLRKTLSLFFSREDKKFVERLWLRSEKKVGFWFLKIIIGCLFLGIASYISFLVLDTDYPLSLALLAGVFNFIPIVGPIIATFIIFMVLALDSLSKALLSVLIYGVLQQIENNIVGPLLARKFAKLSPVLVLISLAAGAKLFGLLGAILMVPLVGVLAEFSKGFFERRQERSNVEVKSE